MFRITILAWTFVCAALFAGCGMSQDELEAYVRGEMQRDIVKRTGMKDLKVQDLQLVRDGDSSYVGVAQCVIGEHPIKFDVTCKYDGSDAVIWNAELSKDNDTTFLAKESAKEIGQSIKAKTKAAYEKASEKAKSAYGKASAKAKEASKTLAEKTKELYDTAAEKAGEVLDKVDD